MKLLLAAIFFACLVSLEALRMKTKKPYHKDRNHRNRHHRCPRGVERVRCSVDLCEHHERCEAYPMARCKLDNCGGCKAQFYLKGRKVDCEPTPQCPGGVPQVTCSRNPCDSATCLRNRRARCVPDFCGKCSAKFYDNGKEVDCGTEEEAQCPPGVKVFRCFLNPCLFAPCARYPEATCVADYCGGCKRKFYLKGKEVNCEKSTNGLDSGECPEGIPVHRCFADPCNSATCQAYPDAKCVSNYCGGCNAHFFVGERQVKCGEEKTGVDSGECPEGVPVHRCFADPCESATCKEYPDAKCKSNYCGGCNAHFFVGERQVKCEEE